MIKLQGLELSAFDIILKEVIPESMLNELQSILVVDVNIIHLGEPFMGLQAFVVPPYVL
jgi:hypothetical protein